MDHSLRDENQKLYDITIPVWRFTDVLGMFFVGLLVLSVGGGAVLFAFDDGSLMQGEVPTITLELAFAMITLEIVAIGVAVGIVGVVRRINWAEATWLRPMSLRWWMRSALIGIACIPLVGLVSLGTQMLVYGNPVDNPQIDTIMPDGFTWIGLIGMTISVGLLIPFFEELFFRGVLLTWLWGRWSFVPAALISSALFGFIHGEIYLMTGTAVLGFIAALTMRWSGSLWSAVVIHAMNNAIQVMLAYIFLG